MRDRSQSVPRKAIMDGVKAINAAKNCHRELLGKINRMRLPRRSLTPRQGVTFSPNGLGAEDAHQTIRIAIPAPERPGGVQFGVVPLVDGEVTSRHELDAAKDAIRKQEGPRRQAA